MAITVGTYEPSCFTVGDTVSWIRTEPDYPAPTWHLVYGFAGPKRFIIQSVASGTTGMVALELGRKVILIELNPKYGELIEHRCNVTPGLALA